MDVSGVQMNNSRAEFSGLQRIPGNLFRCNRQTRIVAFRGIIPVRAALMIIFPAPQTASRHRPGPPPGSSSREHRLNRNHESWTTSLFPGIRNVACTRKLFPDGRRWSRFFYIRDRAESACAVSATSHPTRFLRSRDAQP